MVALDHVDLSIEPGTFLTLLGPSGCGKTTMVRCVDGLEDPDDGEIYIGNSLIYSHEKGVSVPPGQRNLGLVFQNYALWSHMKVYKNITFALEIQKKPKHEMDKRVKEALRKYRWKGTRTAIPGK